MAERSGIGIKKDYKLLNWEQNDFPIACPNCLGDSEFMRMLKKPLGAECRICTRPFTVFKWSLRAHSARQKRTEICSTCAKINNCCQVCAHDLQFDLPIEIRNKLLGDNKIELLMSEGNKDIFAHLANEQINDVQLPYDKLEKYLNTHKSGLTNIPKVLDIENQEAQEKETVNDNTPTIRRKVYDKYLHLNEEQKGIIKAMEQAEKLAKGGLHKEVTIRFVEEEELGIIRKKISNVLEGVDFELIWKNGVVIVVFNDNAAAERFFKVFFGAFVIKGKMLSLSWPGDENEMALDEGFFGLITDQFLPADTDEIGNEVKLGKRENISVGQVN